MTTEVESTGINTDVGVSDAVTSETSPETTKETSGSTEEGGDQAYTPDFKYRVREEEREFDDSIKKLIKDRDSEKTIRDLYTRADGIETIKQDRENIAQELNSFRAEKATFDESLRQLSHFVQTDDLQSFFDHLQIPKEQVLRYALREIQLSENPQLRQQYEQQRQANLHNYNQQMYGQAVQTQYEQQAVNLRERELDFTMRQPELLTMVESFDSRVGKPGAFRDEVIQRGQFHFQTKGIDMPVDQVVKEVIQVFGLGNTQTPQVQGVNGKPGVVQGSRNKPVIPSIPGSGQSAVKREMSGGLKGLKQRAAEVMARG